MTDPEVLKEFGAEAPMDLTATRAAIIACGELGDSMQINTQKLRFYRLHQVGYIYGDEGADTPVLTIGRCSSLH